MISGEFTYQLTKKGGSETVEVDDKYGEEIDKLVRELQSTVYEYIIKEKADVYHLLLIFILNDVYSATVIFNMCIESKNDALYTKMEESNSYSLMFSILLSIRAKRKLDYVVEYISIYNGIYNYIENRLSSKILDLSR